MYSNKKSFKEYFNNKNIAMLLKTVEKCLDTKGLNVVINGNQILFVKNNIIYAYFFLDEIIFENSSFSIYTNLLNNFEDSYAWQEIDYLYKKIIKSADKILLDETSNDNLLSNIKLYHEKCIRFFMFLIKMPEKYLNTHQLEFKKKWISSNIKSGNQLFCPICSTPTFEIINSTFMCTFCKNKFSYKHQFNFCKITDSILMELYKWDKKIFDFFHVNKMLYLYFVALTLDERNEYNLDFKMFTNSMKNYQLKGFDTIDDDGNIHTYFFYFEKPNYILFRNKKYLNKYWEYELKKIEQKINEINQKYPNKKFSIIYINKPDLLTGINMINTKSNYKNIFKTLNDKMYEIFKNNRNLSKYKNLEKIEIFSNISLNHYVIGFKEITYSLTRFLLGSLDLKLHTYDNQNQTFRFNGPQHGFMELILNEIDALYEIARLDMMLYCYDYALSDTELFKKSWLLKHAIIYIERVFKRIFDRLSKINISLKENLFKKTS